MDQINQLREQMPESTKDVRLNLSSVLQNTILEPRHTWAVALTSAYFLKDERLRGAIIADAAGVLGPDDHEDALAAAALMAMNTVFYRSKHMLAKPSYDQRRAGLRMNRMGAPATSRQQFELCAMACAALAGCEACLKSHEESLIKTGLSEDHVHETLRIAAVVCSASVALAGALPAGAN